MKQLTLRLDDSLHKETKLLCVKSDMSINDYVTELIKKDLEQKRMTSI